MLDSVKDGLCSFIAWCWSAGSGFGIDSAQQSLTFDTTTTPDLLMKIINVTGPIGITLMVLHFMIGLFQDMSNEKDSDIRMFVNAGIYVILADLMLMASPKIIGTLMSLSNSFMGTMMEVIDLAQEDMGNSLQEMNDQFSNMSLMSLLFTALISTIGILPGIIAGVLTFVVCTSAKIELLLRYAYMPIGLSSVASGPGGGREALRYLKKLFASSFYFGAICLALYLANTLGKEMLVNPQVVDGKWGAACLSYITNGFYQLGIPLAAVGVIATAKQIINEAFGV